ncbi:hypothetical protein D6783_04835 [Candidatus Woesearchaeota archaeon]|nr:MAG: hypothetical protein D6783_04835 [Candidatus Woesearchaeota archaeon]
MLLTKENITTLLRQKGPLYPARIKKELGGDTTFIGAILSELAASGAVKVTNIKIGSSPFYYLPGQEPRLESLATYLNEKDRKTLEKLKRAKLLKDKEQTPLERVSLRTIKDYAKPLIVKTSQGEELYWKYYLASDAQIQALLAQKHQKNTPAPAPPRPEQKHRSTTLHEQKNQPARYSEHQRAPPAITPASEHKTSPNTPDNKQTRQETLHPKAPPPTPSLQRPRRAPEKQATQEQQTITPKDTFNYNDKFYKKIKKFFEEKKIKIKEQKIIRKNTDIELVITIPTTIGRQEFFCKAKNKKRSNEGDLSAALLQGQLRKLPVIYLTTGDVTKKALEKISHELKGITVKHLP